ncbi:MAG TPA: Gfo/Idh/MocA family oxidoreductase [Polyangia bacterium]|nr:Gfo/Idh/MocA family oxidoreductase [Polyangia bacterium]
MGANDSVRVAVIGAGHWGPNLIRSFDNPPASAVRAVVDRDGARLAQVRGRFPHVQIHEEAERVFTDKDVDAVVIATPTSTHYALVKAALAAGKHVLVEKPITTRGEEAAELTEFAARAGRVLMVGHIFLFNQAVQRVRGYIEGGELGRLYYVSMVRTNLGPIRMDVNAAWDLMSHDISIANYWLGGQPESASALGGNWINAGIHDAVFATLSYPNGVMVNVHASWLNPRKARDITVAGDKRMLVFDDMSLLEPVRIYDKQVTDKTTKPAFVDSFASFRASVREGDITIPRITTGEPLRAECDHFIDCVKTGKTPVTGGREGAAIVRALEAIERSIRNKGRQEPVKQS